MSTAQITVVSIAILALAGMANWQGGTFGHGDIQRTAGVSIPVIAAYVAAIKTLSGGPKDGN